MYILTTATRVRQQTIPQVNSLRACVYPAYWDKHARLDTLRNARTLITDSHKQGVNKVMLALASPTALAWISVSQSLYGAQIEGIRSMQHHTSDLPREQLLGYLWTLPEESTDRRGLG